MDQKRCLLDVIDNPQLLQSFLETESNAETNNNNPTNTLAQNYLNNAYTTITTSNSNSATTTITSTTTTTTITTTTTTATTTTAPTTTVPIITTQTITTPTITTPTITTPTITTPTIITPTITAPTITTPTTTTNTPTTTVFTFPSPSTRFTNPPSTNSTTISQQTTTQPQFSSPGQQQQQQLVFQTSNNGIRQPAILSSSSMGTPLVGMPQQQRVIQIQTANGPMYFAIAPGPAMTNNPMMMAPRIPRMPNQMIMNRPISSPGQLLPGQQQFIQIQTPNGPMLLALPAQTAQQPAQNINNPMIDYSNQVQQQQQQQQLQQQQPQQHQLQPQQLQQQPLPQSQSVSQHGKSTELSAATSPKKQATSTSSRSPSTSNAKSGLDLGDLLLDCGILPEERMNTPQSLSSVRAPQSPYIPQISSPLAAPQINSPMSSMDPSSLSNNSSQQALPNYTGQPLQQQPIRITIGPDGQMIMQPNVYGAIRPVLTNSMGQAHLNPMNSNTIILSNSPMMSLTSSPSTPNTETPTVTKKSATKGKGTAAKRSRSKKSDLDKFPILKTTKIARQQQQQQQKQQQQQQQQQQMQAVTVVPTTVLVGDQNKVLGGSDVKVNVGQLGSSSQVSLARIVTPVMQTALQPLVNSNMIQNSISQPSMSDKANVQITNSFQNTQLASESGNSISGSSVANQNTVTEANLSNLTVSSTSQMSPSGNVTTNLLQRINQSGTVESNPHISSSLMPKISLSVDSMKIEQNGIKKEGQNENGGAHSNKGQTTTLVLHQTQAQHQTKLNQVQQVARQVDLRAQSILNQLGADQNAALNPQTKQSFKSFEDACKRLLRYHVFDAQTISEAQIKKIDEIFDAAAESLLSRKKAIYDKYRLLILKQSMKIVPSNEEVMLDQIFINDEHTYLKKESELFREYEAQLENMSFKQAKADFKLDSGKTNCAPEYFAFGENSPKRNSVRDGLSEAANSRDIDDWLMDDKWNKSRYPTVPDSEAATAIESILNEELS